MDGCLWAAVETRSLIEGHVGEGVVRISLMVEWRVNLTRGRWNLGVQIKRKATKWSSRSTAQQRNPGGAGEVRGLDTKKTSQSSEQGSGVIGLLVFSDLLQIRLELHLLFSDTSSNCTEG